MVGPETSSFFPNPVIERLPQTSPADEANQKLVDNVHPTDWKNPTPSGRYNLVVIGAGTAGLVTAAGAAGLGAKVALIERDLMGGDCLNVGCVPSKAIISAARSAAAIRRSENFGVKSDSEIAVDFAAIMQRMRTLRASISVNDSASRFQSLGVDVFLGDARFLDSDTIEVGEQRLKFKRAVIATGARAAAPSIPGFEDAPYLTNETLFSLTDLPARLGVIGAGPIGCEMAQAFANLGSHVTLFDRSAHILSREDVDASKVVAQAMRRDGVDIRSNASQLRITSQDGTAVQWHEGGEDHQASVDHLLIAAGRQPNVEGLNLDAVGVLFNDRGIEVNERLQTTNRRIFAAGDICSPLKFTHAADFMARTVIQNTLFFGRKKWTDLVIPWCTYTSPEIAHVGITEAEADQQGISLHTITQSMEENDRAILEGETEGFVKVHLKKGSDKILGATIVAPNAGDMISEITLAMTHKIGLGKIASSIHPYPTQAEAIRKAGDQYNRTRLTPFVKSMFDRWLKWTR